MAGNNVQTLQDFPVALISVPWSLFNRPSIQLGALQAYLQEKSACPVQSHHLYLDVAACIGPQNYHHLSLSGWAGEALFAGLLFPERKEAATRLFVQSMRKQKFTRQQFGDWSEQIDALCRSWVERQDFGSIRLAGFSVCFNQLFGSLYLARLIKDNYPKLPIVFGGSSCTAMAGESLQTIFPEIDYLIDGEGEEQLLSLCHRLKESSAAKKAKLPADLPACPAVKSLLTDLDQLPYPDYSDYFRRLVQLFGTGHFIPILPIEFSRGCHWNRCAFCNLNLQWQGYRWKSAERMLGEVSHFAIKSESLRFTFTDNALPPKEADKFFKNCNNSGIDFDFFAEIRSVNSRDRLATYRLGGLRTVQIGIEALSTSLLEKMNKGTTALDNIAAMKHCAELGIQMEGNLILEFPSTTEEEIGETLANLEIVLPYYPLQPATFFLGYGSPVFNFSRNFGIRAITAHHQYRQLIPADILKKLQLMACDYHGDRRHQRQLWQPVRKKLLEWQQFQKGRAAKRYPALAYQDGGSFLIIEQELVGNTTLHHRLRGTSRQIYLFCNSPRTTAEILGNFPRVSEKALDDFVAMMAAKKLLYRENDRVLALAIPRN